MSRSIFLLLVTGLAACAESPVAPAADVPAPDFSLVDTSPPLVAPVVTGTQQPSTWYTSDVTVNWNVSDPESPYVTTGCGTTVITADTDGQVVGCSATSTGGSFGMTVTIKRDATAPTITWAGNLGTYGPLDMVEITCAAADELDPGSGLAADTCADISAPAYTFGGGVTTIEAKAIDHAGNETISTVQFEVVANTADLGVVLEELVPDVQLRRSLQSKLDAAQRAHERGNMKAREGAITAFFNEVAAHAGKKITHENALLLLLLADSLFP